MSKMSSVVVGVNRALGRRINLHVSSATFATIQQRLAATVSERQMGQLMYQKRLVDLIQGVDGDLVECGVGLGRSLLFWALLNREGRQGRRIWGFDSFEGFPEPAAVDMGSKAPKKGRWANNRDGVVALLSAAGFEVAWRRPDALDAAPANRAVLTLVKGFFGESTPRYDRPIALLHIDADLHASYTDALTHLYPKVVPGGVVAFDEYEQVEKWPGARKAIDEYFAGRRVTLIQDPRTGKYYLVKPAA